MNGSRGFTLVELMVAVSIFAIVMMIGVGALLSLVETNRRAQAINSVMNNLNAAVESMSRSMRVGTTYHCRDSSNVPSADTLTVPQDCQTGNGNVLLAFEPADGDPDEDNDQTVYRLNGRQLERSVFSGAANTWVALTAPEVSIDDFDFFVIGSPRGDGIQPRILMRIKGSARVPGGTTQFTIQSSVVQRLLDL
jgi:prepilin-type N-terminal cleavage/methylation domain-containing protein